MRDEAAVDDASPRGKQMAKTTLTKYHAKRDFTRTAEPEGKTGATASNRKGRTPRPFMVEATTRTK